MNWKVLRRLPLVRRGIFVGANLLALVIFYFLFIEPVRRIIAEGAEAVAERRQTLARYEAVVSHEEQIQDYARQVANINASGELIEGDSEGVINANLQARLKSIAEASRVTVKSIQMLPEKEFRGVTLVGARIQATGSYESIHELARAIEGAPPLLIITTAALRVLDPFWGGGGNQAEQNIDVEFDVFGGAPLRGHR
ncbi:MAG: general secretion pathway protein GspM [Alphaproteobacteria bacterium]|nr:general secretion pathway protein GspM [Alphaproteobacteria bacterium]MBM3642541.1 general secretion pathway protein GspM [Alphaproteobacteria bacterium]MBM3653830.1 general secretion pathway protein GspM [Alphaproteobacteria bacterium]